MELRHLRTFVTVVDQGTVSKAAQKLRIAQPALSRQISELQHQLGLKLFDRVGRRLVLTGAGERMLEYCRSVLGSVGSLTEQAELLRCGDTGSLTVAASPVQIETALAPFLPLYVKRYPNVKVTLVKSVGADTLAMLERGEVHLGISLINSARAADSHLGFHPVPGLELVAASHPRFQFEHGSTVDVGRLTSHPLLVVDLGFMVRRTFDAACRLAKLKPAILLESRAPHTLMALAEAGLGIAIIPSAMQTYRYALDVVRITYEARPLTDPLAVVWDRRRTLPRYAETFCELLAIHMRKLFPIAHPPTKSSHRRR